MEGTVDGSINLHIFNLKMCFSNMGNTYIFAKKHSIFTCPNSNRQKSQFRKKGAEERIVKVSENLSWHLEMHRMLHAFTLSKCMYTILGGNT